MRFALFLLAYCVCLLNDDLQSQTKGKAPSFESIQKDISRGRQYVLVLLKRGPKSAKIDSTALEVSQRDHLVHLFKMKSQGVLPLFGPVTEDVDLRGICIFNLEDKDKVKAMLDDDAHIQSGRLVYELYSWFGLPGDKLPK